MRKSVAAIAMATLAMSLAACSDITNGLGSYNISGTFQLDTFNGSPLPTIMYQDSFEQHQLLDETFTIYSDGTYTDDYSVRIYTRNGSTQSSYRDVGTYTQNNTALQFRDSQTGDVFTGSITGNTLTISQLGDVYVYRR